MISISEAHRPLSSEETFQFSSPEPVKKNLSLLTKLNSVCRSASTTDTCSTPGLSLTTANSESGENDADRFSDLCSDIENVTPKANKYAKSAAIHTFPKKKAKSKLITDRFVPSRKTSRLNLALTPSHEHNSQTGESKNINIASIAEEEPNFSLQCLYKNLVLGYDNNLKLLPTQDSIFANNNIFRYRDENHPSPLSQQHYIQQPLMNCDKVLSMYQSTTRKVPKTPFKVLDAPALQDDFYLNLLDWSSQNVLGVGLSSCVYLWSSHTGKVAKLCDLGASDSVTSLTWAPTGDQICVGTNSGEVQIWDSTKLKKVQTLSGHSSRVSAAAWSTSLLASGSRDQSILYRDLRLPSNYISRLTNHTQEVCGLKWSFDGQQLASGGNDNKVYIWSVHSNNPVTRFSEHKAAVKALAWSPHQHGLLATGGGTADKTIRFWNTLQSTQVNCIETDSQVCNLIYSKNSKELVSTHGYSQNQIILWKYPTMEKVTTLTGHSYRVLYLAMSPDGQTIVTGAGDETLRFWNLFPSAKENSHHSTQTTSKLMPSRFDLR